MKSNFEFRDKLSNLFFTVIDFIFKAFLVIVLLIIIIPLYPLFIQFLSKIPKEISTIIIGSIIALFSTITSSLLITNYSKIKEMKLNSLYKIVEERRNVYYKILSYLFEIVGNKENIVDILKSDKFNNINLDSITKELILVASDEVISHWSSIVFNIKEKFWGDEYLEHNMISYLDELICIVRKEMNYNLIDYKGKDKKRVLTSFETLSYYTFKK